MGHGLALGGGGVHGDVEGDQPPALSLGLQHYPGGVVNGTREPVEFSHHKGRCGAGGEILKGPGQSRSVQARGTHAGVLIDGEKGKPSPATLGLDGYALALKAEAGGRLFFGRHPHVAHCAWCLMWLTDGAHGSNLQ